MLEGAKAAILFSVVCLAAMREIDKATVFEMQRDVFQQLRHNIRDKRMGLHERDAYEGLLGVIPPKEKRGLVMIDPPYEIERKDFPQLVELLQTAYKNGLQVYLRFGIQLKTVP